MLNDKIQKALNDQIQKELSSAYLYLAMSAYLDSQNFPGAAHWTREQYKEELAHAGKFMKYVADRGGRTTLDAVGKPAADYGTLKDVFTAILAHEQKITASINALYDVATAEKDYPTQIELQWFIKEQVEEEKSVQDVLVQIDACEARPHLMLMIDHHLGKRGG
jgi:ferritin